MAGTSLGGFVANRHCLHYNSADVYVPLLAGAALGDVFIDSVYSKGLSRVAKANAETVKALLNFDRDFATAPRDNVFPLLARYDQIVLYDRQRRCYGNRPVATLNRGHVTGALAHAELRRHVLQHLPMGL